MAITIFPSILPDDETYDRQELMEMCEASTLQGIAAAHTTTKIDGQSSAIEIADFLSGNHTIAEVDGILEIVRDSEPPRSEVELAPALNEDGTLSRY